jgi:FAD/FMN-containing dehydrogenase
MQQATVIQETAVLELGFAFDGPLLRDGEPGYDEARALHNGMFDRHPALIARCTGAADVIAAIQFARANDLQVSVRGGGHGVPGYAVCEGGVMIDLTTMGGVVVDPASRTARAQGGANWGTFDRETQVFGLATTGGRVTTTGVGGLTLGSGSGWLERKYGWTGDNLLSAQVVTAAGEVVVASESENDELFWGLRGGGGNFGVVTQFEFALHELGPIVLGGMLMYRREKAPEVFRAWRDFMRQAPDEVGSAFAMLTAPPEEFVPEEVRGQPVCGIIFLYAGSPDEGEDAAAGMRGLGDADMDLVMPMPYTAVQRLLDPGNPPGRSQYWKSDNAGELSDAAIDTLIERANEVTSPFSLVLVEYKGGAIARIPDDATALPGRDAEAAFYGFAQWEGAGDDEHLAWAQRFGETMAPYGTSRYAVNFAMDEGEDRLKTIYGSDRYKRLIALKDRYDPDNVFCLNQNIKPSGSG